MKWKKVIITIAVLVLTIFAFLTWYKFHYSMETARSFEVNSTESKYRVLIATQGSEFKDAVVAGVIAHLKPRQVYIKVIDVSALPQVKEENWNAIVILHTWENWKPQADAKHYLERVKNRKKVIVLTTSGRGDFKMEGVDVITTASVMTDGPARIREITKRLDFILGS